MQEYFLHILKFFLQVLEEHIHGHLKKWISYLLWNVLSTNPRCSVFICICVHHYYYWAEPRILPRPVTCTSGMGLYSYRHYNSRMAQTTQWLQAIKSCIRKVRLKYQQCMASFPAQTAKISSKLHNDSHFRRCGSITRKHKNNHNSLQPRPLD